MSQQIAVSCKNIIKSYKSGKVISPALRGVNLDIFTGELRMLVGPSGCGKTTLISIIAGILDPSEGSCSLYGQDYQKLKESQRTIFRGKNIGFVFQSFNLIPTLTAAENVSVPLIIQGEKRSTALKKACEYLEKVNLSNKINSYPKELSGGQQQRVAIARALIHEPKLIVCDEPTSALDQETGKTVLELFKKLAVSDNKTVIVVTHDSRIYHFADRITKMNDGMVVEDLL